MKNNQHTPTPWKGQMLTCVGPGECGRTLHKVYEYVQRVMNGPQKGEQDMQYSFCMKCEPEAIAKAEAL